MEENLKHLLIKDLSARLPYGVKVEHLLHAPNNPSDLFAIDVDKQILYCDHKGREEWYKVDFIQPYLRPMSSMTLEELEEYRHFGDHIRDAECKIHIANYEQIDWLLKNHFDYRGLIPKGLAIAVTESNNPYKD